MSSTVVLIQIATLLVCFLSTINTEKEFQTKCSLTSSFPSVLLVRRWLALSSSLDTHVFLIVSQMLYFQSLLHPFVLQWATFTRMCVFKCICAQRGSYAALWVWQSPVFLWNMLWDDLLNFLHSLSEEVEFILSKFIKELSKWIWVITLWWHVQSSL